MSGFVLKNQRVQLDFEFGGWEGVGDIPRRWM